MSMFSRRSTVEFFLRERFNWVLDLSCQLSLESWSNRNVYLIPQFKGNGSVLDILGSFTESVLHLHSSHHALSFLLPPPTIPNTEGFVRSAPFVQGPPKIPLKKTTSMIFFTDKEDLKCT